MNKFDIIKNRDKEYVAGTYNRNDIGIEKGQGAICYDYDGKEYIDFTSGIGVNSLGYSNDGWMEAVNAQLHKVQHTSNLFFTEPATLVAEKMCERTGMKKMFFSNSGAEANEGAIKTVRKYSLEKYGIARHEIITLKNSFHGRTMATITATGQATFHKYFNPLLDGFVYIDPNDISQLITAVTQNTCAIMIELIQGEGGVNVLEQDFVNEIANICEDKDILLIVDEVQTGMGRTGRFMACEHYGLTPDIMTVAKGLGGGLPIGGILFGEKTENALSHGDHGSTFGGNPAVCAGANYILDCMDSVFLNEVEQKGQLLMEKLAEIDEVKSVSGKGLMIGVDLENKEPAEIVKKCAENGLLILTAKDKLRLLPPLTITQKELLKGLQILQFAVM